MSKDVDTHDLFKGDTFRTAFLSELVDFVCEKKPHKLIIGDLEYVKIVRCKDCIHYWKNSPSVDAEPVVRCKDCKYSEPSVYPQAVNCTVLSKAIREWAKGYGCPGNKDKACPATDPIMTVFEDHYCGWGERR